MDRTSTRALGEYGERLACRYLTDHGLVVLDRNWRCARGEIDVVARDGPCLVVCEVKTRSSTAFGQPFEAVTPAKLRRLRRLAGLWLEARRAEGCGEDLGGDVRVDVVSVLRPPTGPARVEHLRGVS